MYAWESLKLLGGVTVDGETFYLRFEDNFINDLTIQLLDALYIEFGEIICVVLDNVPYFAANKLPTLARSSGQAMGKFRRDREEIQWELAEMQRSATDRTTDADRKPESEAAKA